MEETRTLATLRRSTAGRRFPADPPRVEEIVAVMKTAGESPYALRLRALIVILWRAGLRISEALALAETDLESARGSLLVRSGQGRETSRGRHGRLGMGSACRLARTPSDASGRTAPVRDQRAGGRPAVDAQCCPPEPAASRSPGRRSPQVRAAPATACTRRGDGARGRAAERDPAPARPRQPRRDERLSPGDRHGGDRQHHPPATRADRLGDGRALASPLRRARMSLLTRACDLLPQVLPRGLISMSGQRYARRKPRFCGASRMPEEGLEPPTRGL